MNNNYILLKRYYPNIYTKVCNVEIDENKYELITTRQGLFTLKINGYEQFYLHSKYNPIRESEKFIDENYSEEFNNYLVYGLGFGYHIESLLEKSEDISINVIESNIYILKLALDNIDLSFILENPRVKINLGDSLSEFKKSFDEASRLSNYKLVIYNSSIKSIPSEMKEIRYLLEEFKVKEKSTKNTKYNLDSNFEYNKDNYDEVINTLFTKFSNIPIFLVSAGPSLDKNKHLLKDIDDKGIILCVGRAVKSLLSIGVTPDFVIITDSQSFVYKRQLQGLGIEVPIIILSTCDENVMKNYQGKKYIAFQNGYDRAEKYAKNLELKLVETGGSVATTGLDIAIRMGGNPIVFVGQDLAFSDGKTHSKGTYHGKIKETVGLRKVIGVDGQEIYTSKNLSIYLRWIEKRIRNEKNIEFIDATEGGVKIEGTKVMKLEDVIHSNYEARS